MASLCRVCSPPSSPFCSGTQPSSDFSPHIPAFLASWQKQHAGASISTVKGSHLCTESSSSRASTEGDLCFVEPAPPSVSRKGPFICAEAAREHPSTSLARTLRQISLEQHNFRFQEYMESQVWASFAATPMAAAPLLCAPRFNSQEQESSKRDDFYANMGSAIRTIREEMPVLFYRDLNYDIYREDITFRDPRNTFTGIDNYKLLFWALRFHGRIFFKAIRVDVLRIWQPSDGVIVVRWMVRGIPRVPWEAQGIFEGTSEYKLDKHGKIYEHKIDNVALNYPPMLKNFLVLDLLSANRAATPTPTFFDKEVFGIPFSASKTSTWELFYLAVVESLQMEAIAHEWSWIVAV